MFHIDKQIKMKRNPEGKLERVVITCLKDEKKVTDNIRDDVYVKKLDLE